MGLCCRGCGAQGWSQPGLWVNDWRGTRASNGRWDAAENGQRRWTDGDCLPTFDKVDGVGFARFPGPHQRFERGVPFCDVHAMRPGQTVGGAGDPQELAHGLLAGLDDRWDHTREVAARARSVAAAVPDEDRGLLVDAAWLHDIGYSPQAARTGFGLTFDLGGCVRACRECQPSRGAWCNSNRHGTCGGAVGWFRGP